MNAKGEAVEPQEFGGGEAIWTDMPKYKEAGGGSYELINYEVKLTYVDKLDSNVYEDIEDYGYRTNEVIDGYTYYFTSVHDSDKITVTAEKVWNDGLTERPFYTPWIIGLSLSGVDAEPTEVDTATYPNKWVYTWEDLYRYDNSGETIEYTLTEENTPEGYESVISEPSVDSGSGNISYTVTNTSLNLEYNITISAGTGGSAEAQINKIEITELDEVKAGETPDTEAKTPDNSHYAIDGEIKWYNGENAVDAFEGNIEYTAKINVKPESGNYVFAETDGNACSLADVRPGFNSDSRYGRQDSRA